MNKRAGERGFGSSALCQNKAEGPVCITKAVGKGRADEATAFLLSSGDVGELIEVFPGVSGFRENSGGFSACRWFVYQTQGLPALAALPGCLGSG